MILKATRIKKYKSITDSSPIELADGVTCLVGKNESGKTAILETLYRLNPLPMAHPQEFNGLRDYPRRTYNRDRDSVPSTIPVEATFHLEPADVEAFEAEFGKNVLESNSTPFKRAMKTSTPGPYATTIATWLTTCSLQLVWTEALGLEPRRYRN